MGRRSERSESRGRSALAAAATAVVVVELNLDTIEEVRAPADCGYQERLSNSESQLESFRA